MFRTSPHAVPSGSPGPIQVRPPTSNGRALRSTGRLTFAAAFIASAATASIAFNAEDLARATLETGRACGNSGLAGTLTAGETVVHFESCPSDPGAFAVVRDASGQVLTEFIVDGKTVVFRIGGVTIDDANTDEDRDRMAEALSTPEARLVAGLLWPKLIEAGYRKTERTAVAALYANLTAYEFLTSENSSCEDDCLGCCGNGCPGCMGCYTQLCLQHDQCIRRHGSGLRAHLKCAYLLPAAAFSAWECR